MQKQLIIGCDVDGVLADFNTAYRQRLINVTGRELIAPFVDGHEPSVWNYATDEYGYTKEEDSAVWKSIIADRYFWGDLCEYPRAVMFLSNLRYVENDGVYFITTRPGLRVKRQTEEWLHNRCVSNPTVLIAKNADAKGMLAAGLGLTHFIDDRPENCLAVKTQSPHTDVYLLDHKYNRWACDDVRYTDTTRIHSLDDFLAALNGTEQRTTAA
jgi:hypothetical protein